jgi:hypothetical protein
MNLTKKKLCIPKLIGITGRKFNGKDTLAKYFINTYNYKRYAFADPLKEACRHIFGFNDDQLYGELKEQVDEYWNTTPRNIFQYVGTELFRNNLSKCPGLEWVEENIWYNVLKKSILDQWEKNPDQLIVITDIRFQNEIDLIKELGGISIKITKDNILNTDTHTSEIDIDKLNVDYNIKNNGTISDLYKNADNLIFTQ